ncbi:hypothetical protein BGZ83_009030 [Gryganskiella cystojenkinii]|nr:hypothetical protein BGZ83_009030 [Gryganskiella cystojenkinii]
MLMQQAQCQSVQTPTVHLLYLIDGDSAADAFPVTVSPLDTVDSLKKLIKTRTKPKFDDITIDELTLWHVLIHDNNNDDDSPMLSHTQHEMKKLHGTSTLSEVLEDVVSDLEQHYADPAASCKAYDVFNDQQGSGAAVLQMRGVSSDVESYFQQMLQAYGWNDLKGDLRDVVTSFLTAWISMIEYSQNELSYLYNDEEARVQRGNWSTYHDDCKHSAWRAERIGLKEAFRMSEVNYGTLHIVATDFDALKLCSPERKAAETILAVDVDRVATGADTNTVQHVDEIVDVLANAHDIEPVSHCAVLSIAFRGAIESALPKRSLSSTAEHDVCGHCAILATTLDAGMFWPVRVEHGLSDARVMLTRALAARITNDVYDWKSDSVRGEAANLMRYACRREVLQWLADSVEHAIKCESRNHEDVLLGIASSASYAVMTGRSLLLERLYAEDSTLPIQGYERCPAERGNMVCAKDPAAHVYAVHGEWALGVEKFCIRVAKALDVNVALTVGVAGNDDEDIRVFVVILSRNLNSYSKSYFIQEVSWLS